MRTKLPQIVLMLLAGAIDALPQSGEFDPWTEVARYELECRVDLSPLLASSPEQLRVWIPLPAESGPQRVLGESIESPWPCRKTTDAYDNRFAYVEPARGPGDEREVVLRFTIERLPYSGTKPADARTGSALDPQRFLGPQRRIPLDEEVHRLATEQSRGTASDAERIRAFYDYTLATMRYDKTGQGWGQGDIKWACSAKYGNCTDFHSLFIGLARSLKIPARFVIGFPIPADKTEGMIGGYHCWAEAYDAEKGWIPIDASEAWKAKRPDDYFGRLPADRVTFTVGRDLTLAPRQRGAPLNFFIYPYAEVEGRPVEQVPWEVRFRRVSPAGNKP